MEGTARLGFTKVAELSGVSEASCRRYVKKAPQIFMAVQRDGVTRFPEEAVERFQAAQKGLSEGLRWGEMLRALHEQFGAVYDVGQTSEGVGEAIGSSVALAGIESKLDRLVTAVETLAVAQKANAALRERVDRLEAALANSLESEFPQVMESPRQCPSNSLQEAPGGPGGGQATKQTVSIPESVSKGQIRLSWWKRLLGS